MSSSPRFNSLIVLAKWTHWLGFIFVLRLFYRIPIILSLSDAASPRKGTLLVEAIGGYVLANLFPAVAAFIIPRWVEDGYVWAFATVCIIAMWSIGSIFYDAAFVGSHLGFGPLWLLLLMLPVVRVIAAIAIAWPDVGEVIRARRRSNRARGFEVILPRDASLNAVSSPAVLSSATASDVPLQTGDPITRIPLETVARAQPARIEPRYVPQNMVRTARVVELVGGVMLFFFVLMIVTVTGLVADSGQRTGDGDRIGLVIEITWTLFIPGLGFIWLARWIKSGWPWAVATAAATAGICILGQVVSAILFPAAGASVCGFVASFPSFLVLVLCVYLRGDAREISRAMARDRLSAERNRTLPSAPKLTARPPIDASIVMKKKMRE